MATAAQDPQTSGGASDGASDRASDGGSGRASDGPRGSAVRDALLVLGVWVVLGVLAGVLWSLVVTPADYTKLAAGGAMGEADFGKQFGADGWFAVIGVLAGLVAGLGLVAWRSRDPLLVLGLVVVGSCLASVLMMLVGHLLGPGDPGAALRTARLGGHVPERLDLGPQIPGQPHQSDLPVYLSWPIGALIGAMFVLFGRGSSHGARGLPSDPDEADGRQVPPPG